MEGYLPAPTGDHPQGDRDRQYYTAHENRPDQTGEAETASPAGGISAAQARYSMAHDVVRGCASCLYVLHAVALRSVLAGA